MALTYALLVDEVSKILEDTTNAVFSDAEIGVGIQEAVQILAEYSPYVTRDPYKLEVRTGTATATTASHLVDATEAQFLSTDVGKWVYNTTDKTWATISAYNSTSNVTLTRDIMASGEGYRILNDGCSTWNQINVEDTIIDSLNISGVEYPLGSPRNFTREGNILTILLDSEPDADTDDLEVWLTVERQHRVCQLTDLLGAVDLVAGYVEGDTSMVVDGITTAEVIEAGQEFTIPYSRNVYRAAANVTIAGSEATVTFFPALDMTVADGTVVTFRQSTLNPTEERLVAEIAAARAAINKPNSYNNTLAAEDKFAASTTAIGNMTNRIEQAMSDLLSGSVLIGTGTTAANTAIAVALVRIAQSVTDIGTGRALVGAKRTEALAAIDALTTATTGYLPMAMTDLASARTALNGAGTDDVTDRIASAVADIATALTFMNKLNISNPETEYLRSAGQQLSAANAVLGKINGYYRAATDELTGANLSLAQASAYLASDETVRVHQSDAAAEIQAAMAKLQEAHAYIALSQESNQYVGQAVGQLRIANTYLSQSQAYLSQVNVKIAALKISDRYGAWGIQKFALLQPRLKGMIKPRSWQMYPRD